MHTPYLLRLTSPTPLSYASVKNPPAHHDMAQQKEVLEIYFHRGAVSARLEVLTHPQWLVAGAASAQYIHHLPSVIIE